MTWDWVSIVGTGQSLAIGGHGSLPEEPFGSTQQRYGNLKLSLGDAPVPPLDPDAAGLAMAPLTEPLRPLADSYPSAYPHNIYGQSHHTAMAHQITALVRAATGRDYVTVHTEVGEAGQPINVISKGAADTGATGRAYAASLFEVAAISRLARAAGRSYGVGAITIIHGETDSDRPAYEQDLIRLAADYNDDLRAITGQTAAIPLLVSQQHAVPPAAGTRSPATQAQWRASVTSPGSVVCVGPSYQYPFIGDALHLTNPGYEMLGEKLAQAFVERVVGGRAWRPLQPAAVTRSGRVISVGFDVPFPPLAWDRALPAPHADGAGPWAAGRGFEIRAGDAPVAIASVAIAGDSVRISCATDLPASGVTVAHAFTAADAIRPGGTWRWGLLRDSDPFVGVVTGAAQPNYAVAFELEVPHSGGTGIGDH